MQSSEKPEALEVVQRPDGLADVWLRRSIERVEVPLEGGGSQEAWSAEEAHLVGRYEAAYVDLHFDELWEQARRGAMTDSERLAECEEEGGRTAEGVAELGVLAAESAATLDDVMLAVAELGAAVASVGAEGGEVDG